MTRSVYILGAAGTGKSTFMAQLLEGHTLGEFEPIYTVVAPDGRNATLRGHRVDGGAGLYIGRMVEPFPGSDGLDWRVLPVFDQWFKEEPLPAWIVSEGKTLSNRRFLDPLGSVTHLLMVWLEAPEEVRVARSNARGGYNSKNRTRKQEVGQSAAFLKGSVTTAYNRAQEQIERGVTCLRVDSTDEEEWDMALDLARGHLYYRHGG